MAPVLDIMHIPHEVRDMIWADVLTADNAFYEKRKYCAWPHSLGTAEFCDPQPSSTPPLLLVSKRVYAEAIPVFYAVNMFEMSPFSAMRSDSLFAKHAARFRRLTVMFEDYPNMDEDDRIGIWKAQLRALIPMVNLGFLKLDVSGLGNMLHYHTYCQKCERENPRESAAKDLLHDLLASLPSRLRKARLSKSRGVRLTGWFDADTVQIMKMICLQWRGVNTQFKDGSHMVRCVYVDGSCNTATQPGGNRMEARRQEHCIIESSPGLFEVFKFPPCR